MKYYFLLEHVMNEGSDDEDVKVIGRYTSYELAYSAQMRVCNKPGFIDYPEGFSIHKNPINCDGWVDGFVDL